ncbi:unnamed protein product [Amaranthus hypochondriacus]
MVSKLVFSLFLVVSLFFNAEASRISSELLNGSGSNINTVICAFPVPGSCNEDRDCMEACENTGHPPDLCECIKDGHSKTYCCCVA